MSKLGKDFNTAVRGTRKPLKSLGKEIKITLEGKKR